MQITFDPILFGTALLALWFGFHEYYRNTRVRLRIVDFHCSLRMRAGAVGPVRMVIARVKNLGISLHAPSLALGFRGPDRRGWISCPFQRSGEHGWQGGEFARGMTVEFLLTSDKLGPGEMHMLSLLADPTAQGATLAFFSQGFLVKQRRVGGYAEKLKRMWNRSAASFNGLFDVHTRIPGSQNTILTMWKIIPGFVTIEDHLRQFLREVKKPLS